MDLGFTDKMTIVKMKKIECSFVHCKEQHELTVLFRKRFMSYFFLQTCAICLCLGDHWLEGVKGMTAPLLFGTSYCLSRVGSMTG